MSNRSPHIAILATGTELLSGEINDTNTRQVAELLAGHGLVVRESVCVADREDDITRTLDRLAAENRIVIITGGLGPTEDDLTARAAAKACGRPLILNDEALEQIRARFRQIGRTMHPGNEKQALLPHKVKVLANQNGTAPGFRLRLHEADLYFLPGVPSEMKAMVASAVIPEVIQQFPDLQPSQERRLQVFALSEPRVAELLSKADLPQKVETGFGVTFPFVIIKLRATGEEADEQLDLAELRVRQSLGDFIVANHNETFAGNVGRLLRIKEKRVALAESCTGGLLSKLLTDPPGASAYLERTVVSYANSAKHQALGVPLDLIETYGAVSKECAMAMATGIRTKAGTEIGLAITGIAGPDGGTTEKPVGTVFIALVGPGFEHARRYHFSGDRERVRTFAAHMALDWLRRYLGRLPFPEEDRSP
ncbi:MAG: damage-inducible protein CinA [Desulfuromonas sp.]|nr:MAG: damage-inducible protein CinA [Desulfuromonas sp.]